jgi:hypothetical protein
MPRPPADDPPQVITKWVVEPDGVMTELDRIAER